MDTSLTTSSLLLCISVLALLVVCWFVYKQVEFYVWKLPPEPLGLPLLGYLPFVGKEPQKKFAQLSQKYGPLLSVSLGSYKAVIVSDYAIAKELLNHPATLERPARFFDVLPEKGGFVGMNGDVWQEQRRFCMHTMRTLGVGKSIWEKTIQEDIAELVEYLQRHEGKPTVADGPLGSSIRANIVGLLLGRRLTNKETNPEVELLERTHSVITELFHTSNPAALMPWLLKYLVKFNIAGYAKKMKVLEEFSNLFRTAIKEHQESDCPESMDFIGHYLEAIDKKHETGEISNYSVQNLVGNMAALFFGGSNSTAASIKWLSVLMAEHPEVQKKVQGEIDDIIGRNGLVVWDDRKRLPFTVATIFEMERWTALVPFFPPRCASETFEFRGYTIPKSAMILVNSWAIHRSPKYWENPHLYIPERFLRTSEKMGKDPSKLDGYAPFSFGKRNCPGDSIAIMTIFLYFTGLMQKFTIKAPPGLRVNLNTHFNAVVHPEIQELCFTER